MAERDLSHIVVPTPPEPEPFRLPPTGGGGNDKYFSGDRREHGEKLIEEHESVLMAASEDPETEGTYISFQSFPDLKLALESLDSRRKGEHPELVAVSERTTEDGTLQIATVYIPHGKKRYFLELLEAYVETSGKDKADNANLVEGIQTIRRATIRELWTDPEYLFPSDPSAMHWWEVWLRRHDGHEQQRLTAFAEERQLRTSDHYLGFSDRIVVLLNATADQLADALASLDDIAELRRPHNVANFLTELPAAEQAEWIDDLRGRLRVAPADAPVVCILDTGVQNGHPLLRDSIDASDLHTPDARWSKYPRHPHGTEMAGLALYADLNAAIVQAGPVRLRHRLESVKILPDQGANDPELYGAITARSVDQPEIQDPTRTRLFMLAITAPRPEASVAVSEPDELVETGRPTSWSASIDALSFGRAIDGTKPKFTYLDRDEPPRPRLFIVSAGNIREITATENHLDRSDLEPVEDPAQSWNALSVGAYSEIDDMSGAPPEFAGYVPVARRGELTPISRTSVLFDSKKWPFKPEVVANGGNYARSPDGTSVDTPPNLRLLTTRFQNPGGGFFTGIGDTSAATAQVAAIAADIWAEYPTLRPETVRALIIHSAQWTEVMRSRFDPKKKKADLINLLRRYGMGVPDARRALYSAADALTLIAEAEIHPYERAKGSTDLRAREMNLHQLPWPTQELGELGEVEVVLRVTLSYFVEPNPSSRGWSGRYVYPSHGLRFAMRRPEDSIESFRRRVNTRARDDEKGPPKLATEKGWLFGSDQQRAPGSLHTDIWTGTAVELANKGSIAVYPVGGWWKTRPGHDQSDKGVYYSLVVSIESPEVEVDLWTPVFQQVQPTVEITT